MSQEKLSRRDLLKLLAAATGATILSTVPNKWKTPIVEVGALPAHAQGSQRNGAITGTVSEVANAPQPGKSKALRAPVPNATVSVDGTSLNANTDTNGQYAILNVPPGTHNLTCTNSAGLYPNPATLNGVVVLAGQTTPNQDFFLNVG